MGAGRHSLRGMPAPRPVLLPWLLPLLGLLLLALGPRGAWAQDAFATVVVVTEQDDRGRWRPVSPATRALRERAGAAAPLAPGMALALGDTVRTDLARVELRLATGERLNLSEGTTLVLAEERGVLQELGEVYYRLRDRFRVEYGTVDTVVEGTRFAVQGTPAGVAVRVDEGRVRVENGDAVVVLPRGQGATLPASGPPVAGPGPVRPTPADRARSFPRGRPVATLGAQAEAALLIPAGPAAAAAGTEGVQGLVGLRADGAASLGRHLQLGLATGAQRGAPGQVRLPQELYLAAALPGLRVGLGPVAIWEQRRQPCGARARDRHRGGGGWVEGELALGRRLALRASLRGGLADALWLGAGAGVAVAL